MRPSSIVYATMLMALADLLQPYLFGQGFVTRPPEVFITPLPTGSGARALGQGGAFVSVADDATAASWNPAGLTQLERPEVSIVGSYLTTLANFSVDPETFTLGRERTSRGDINYLSAAMPLPFKVLGRNAVASLNYQQTYDFDLDLSYDFTVRNPLPPAPFVLTQRVNFQSEGAVGALTPAVALQLTPDLSFGCAVNIFTDEFGGKDAWKQDMEAVGRGTVAGEPVLTAFSSEERFRNFEAVNLTFGFLWDVWEKDEKRVTLGLTFDTPFTARLDREFTFASSATFPESGQHITLPPFSSRESLEMDFPASLAGGANFRISDNFHISFDVTWTDWSDFEQRNAAGVRSSPIGGASINGADIEDTIAARLGGEYLIQTEKFVFPLRAGVFYEPRPALGSPIDFVGFSLGAGVTTGKFSIDCAYQYRYGDNIDGKNLGTGLSGIDFDVTDSLFLVSLIYYF